MKVDLEASSVTLLIRAWYRIILLVPPLPPPPFSLDSDDSFTSLPLPPPPSAATDAAAAPPAHRLSRLTVRISRPNAGPRLELIMPRQCSRLRPISPFSAASADRAEKRDLASESERTWRAISSWRNFCCPVLRGRIRTMIYLLICVWVLFCVVCVWARTVHVSVFATYDPRGALLEHDTVLLCWAKPRGFLAMEREGAMRSRY
mmetsp:Transcript_35776/g.78371  ORF Transcript_35776/g.78371 Transcript_35776/m.78371 type:complete len:204 (+) Transcript_35776:165-776(+)